MIRATKLNNTLLQYSSDSYISVYMHNQLFV